VKGIKRIKDIFERQIVRDRGTERDRLKDMLREREKDRVRMK
jgi:hypothetical protein